MHLCRVNFSLQLLHSQFQHRVSITTGLSMALPHQLRTQADMEGRHHDESMNSESQARELSEFFNVVRIVMMEYEVQHLSTPSLKEVYAAIQQKLLNIPYNEISELVLRQVSVPLSKVCKYTQLMFLFQSKLPGIRLIWRDVLCQSLAFNHQDVPVMVPSNSPYLTVSLKTGETQIHVEYVKETFNVPWLYNVPFDDLHYKRFYKDVTTRNPNKDISDHVKAILWTFVIISVYPDENRNVQRLKTREVCHYGTKPQAKVNF